MPEKVTVLLADDHVLVRRGFRRMLEDESFITVVGEAGDGDHSVKLALKLRPNVVLMDYSMPHTSGLIATEEIVRSCPGTAVLMLSMHSEPTLIDKAANAGARGYILKNARGLDLVSAIKRVVAGELVFESHISTAAPQNSCRDQRLTPRELEILQFIVDGKSAREIAAMLGLSVNTVSSHRTNIMKRLGLHKAADLVVYTIRNRLVNIL